MTAPQRPQRNRYLNNKWRDIAGSHHLVPDTNSKVSWRSGKTHVTDDPQEAGRERRRQSSPTRHWGNIPKNDCTAKPAVLPATSRSAPLEESCTFSLLRLNFAANLAGPVTTGPTFREKLARCGIRCPISVVPARLLALK